MQQNPSYEVNLGNWYSHFSHSMGDFSPYNSHGILHHMGNAWVSPSICHTTGKCNRTHRSMENLGNWCSYFSHIMDAFSSIRFPFYGIRCYHMGNALFFPSKSTLWPLWLFFYSIIFCVCSKIYWFLKRKKQKKPIS